LKVYLQKGQKVETRRAIVYALGEIGDKKAADVFLNLLENDEDATIRYWACISLGFMQYKRAAKVLEKILLEDESVRVRRTAALSLGQLELKTKKAISTLVTASKEDSDEEVRGKAKETIKKLAKIHGYKNQTEMLKDLGIK